MTSKHDPNKVTLAFCRQWFEARLDRKKPVKCPCCRKRATKSRRRISKRMIVSLVKMYVRGECDAKSLRDGSGDYAKLRHWGLVEQASYGRWRVTALGRQWLQGRAEVPRIAVTYNRRFVRFDEGPMTVFDCYGSQSGFVAMFARVKAGTKE